MAKLLDGKVVRDEIAKKLEIINSKLETKPKLVIIQVGDNPESNTYINQKIKFGEKIGAIVEHKKFPNDVSEEALTSYILNLNSNPAVHGVILQMPIPTNLDKDKILDKIVFWKDVDGLSSINLKHLSEARDVGIVPATTRGILTLLDYYKIPVSSKKVTIVGRSFLVGKPTALAMINRDATVTICHSKTKDLKKETKDADILIIAAGKPNLITKDHVSAGQVVIDVGINIQEKPFDSAQGKPESELPSSHLIGDVAFDEVEPIVAAITPVPGGVGPMTVASLFENLLEAYNKQVQI